MPSRQTGLRYVDSGTGIVGVFFVVVFFFQVSIFGKSWKKDKGIQNGLDVMMALEQSVEAHGQSYAMPGCTMNLGISTSVAL